MVISLVKLLFLFNSKITVFHRYLYNKIVYSINSWDTTLCLNKFFFFFCILRVKLFTWHSTLCWQHINIRHSISSVNNGLAKRGWWRQKTFFIYVGTDCFIKVIFTLYFVFLIENFNYKIKFEEKRKIKIFGEREWEREREIIWTH